MSKTSPPVIMTTSNKSSKIRRNLREIKAIIDLLQGNDITEKSQYLVHQARIYICETMQLLSDERIAKTTREKAISEISHCSAHLRPLSIITHRSKIGIN